MDSSTIAAFLTAILVIVTVFYTIITRRISLTMKGENDRAAFFKVVDLMEGIRSNRSLIRNWQKDGKTLKDLSVKELAKVDEVCRAFDILGFWDRNGLIKKSYVDQFYVPPFFLLYRDFLGYYVEELRKPIEQGGRGETHFWELVNFYERIKYVYFNHPGFNGLKKWVRNPRKRQKRVNYDVEIRKPDVH